MVKSTDQKMDSSIMGNDKKESDYTYNDNIHVVINRIDLADEYNRHAGATIASILEKTSKPITFHITHDGSKSNRNQTERDKNIRYYQELTSKYGSTIEFVDLQDFKWDNRLPEQVINSWSIVSLCRLQLQDIFPTLDKIILLGIDTIVNTDLAEYIKKCPDSCSICAVPDPDIKKECSFFKSARIAVNNRIENYFNIDAVLLNLNKIRTDNVLIEKIVEYLKQVPHPTCIEQDVLNYAFAGNVSYLPKNYNISTRFYSDNSCLNEYDEFILHYAAPYSKPWVKYHGEIDEWYWNYLAKTPWCKSNIEIRQYLRDAPNYTHCLPAIEKNIFAYIDGERNTKIKSAFNFIIRTWWNTCKNIYTNIIRVIAPRP